MKAAVMAGDQVTLSPMAQELQKLRQSLQDVADVREDTVRDIEDRMARGTYRADTGRIAEAIIREHRLDELA